MNRENKPQNTSRLGFSKRGFLLSCLIVGVLVLTLLINGLVGLIPAHAQKRNVTGSSAFTVSAQTKKWASENINEDITIYLLSSGGAENEIYLFLSEYAQQNDHISLRAVDPAREPEFINAYGGQWPEDMSLIVESGKRYKILNNSDLYYYVIANQMRMTASEYQAYRSYLAQLGKGQESLSEMLAYTVPYFDGETQVTSAIQYVLLDQVSTVYVLTQISAGLDYYFSQTLWKYGYDIRSLQSLQSLPQDCDLLLYQPILDLTKEEKALLESYLESGGKLFLTTSYAMQEHKNLNSVLEKYGMSFLDRSHMLIEGDTDYVAVGQNASTQSTYFYIKGHLAPHAATNNALGSFWLDLMEDGVHAIRVEETEGVTVTPWLQTSDQGYPTYYISANKSEDGEKGVYSFGAIAEKGDTRIVWVATPSAFTNAMNSVSSGGNFSLMMSTIRWMTDTPDQFLYFATAPSIPTSYLTVSSSAFILWATILIVLLPLAALILGIMIYYTRKKK